MNLMEAPKPGVLLEFVDFESVKNFVSAASDKVLYVTTGNTRSTFRQEEYRKYRELEGLNLINMTVKAYPNIYMFIKFDVTSPVLIDHVVNRIKYCAKYSAPFDPEKVRNESLGLMYKSLTGRSMGDMDRSKFKEAYRSFIFGGYQKIDVRVRPDRLLTLMYSLPNIIHHIDYTLLGTYYKELYNFIDKLKAELDTIELYNPSMKSQMPSYKLALIQSVEDLGYVYKVAKSTLCEINDEYYDIMEKVYKEIKK